LMPITGPVSNTMRWIGHNTLKVTLK
jgi:hypothetical protein